MVLSKSKIFLLCCWTAVIGLGFGVLVPVRYIYWLGGVAVILAIVYWHIIWVRQLAMGVAVLVLSVCITHFQQAPDLSKYFDQKITFEAYIINDPIITERSHRFYAQLTGINGQPHAARIAIVLPRYPEYLYGTYFTMEGKLAQVSEFNTKANVSAETVFPQVLVSKPGPINPLKKLLYLVKAKMLAAINTIVPEPQAGLLGGLLLGTRGFSPELSEQFRVTGTSHIVAISGYNVTIVAGIVDGLFRRFGRIVSFYGSLGGIMSLVIITGAEASVVRAGFMGGLVLLARQTGRVYASTQSILLSAVIMMAQNPKLLVFDIGFQLSFAALAGLLYMQPVLDDALPELPLKDYWLPTLAAQITTTPLLLYHFGNLSLVSMLANFLVLAVIPWAMLIGFIAVMAVLIWPAVGPVFGAIAWLPLYYIIKTIEWCVGLPMAAVSGIPFPLWLTAMYYLLLIAYIQKWKPKLLAYSK